MSERNQPNEIVAKSVLFYDAAYETLSSALAFTIHLPVHNERIQDDLRSELQEYICKVVQNSSI